MLQKRFLCLVQQFTYQALLRRDCPPFHVSLQLKLTKLELTKFTKWLDFQARRSRLTALAVKITAEKNPHTIRKE